MNPTAKQRRLVAEMLQEVYGQIDHLPVPLLNKLAPILSQAQREVEKELRDWLSREDGAARFTTQRLRVGLVRTRRAMERAEKMIEPELRRGFRIGSNTAGQLATRHIEQQLVKFGEIFGEMINPVSLDVAAIMASGDKLLVNRFATSIKNYSKGTRDRIASELAVSKIRGETVAEATARLQKRIPAVFQNARARAEMVVRTELMNAYNLQHELGISDLRRDDPDIRSRWDAYRDRRTCLQCASLDGQIIDPAQRSGRFSSNWKSSSGKRFKATHERPPAHPSCRCVLVAWRKDWKDDAFRAKQNSKMDSGSKKKSVTR